MLALTLLLLVVSVLLIVVLAEYEEAHLEDAFDHDHSERERLGL